MVRIDELGEGQFTLAVTSGTWLPTRVQVTAPSAAPVPVELEVGGTLDLTVPSLVGGSEAATFLAFDEQGQHHMSMFGLNGMDGIPLRGGKAQTRLAAGVWRVDVNAADGRTWSGTVTIDANQTSQLILD